MKYIFSILSILILAGCSFVEEPGTPCGNPDGPITLSFKMISTSPLTKTRADAVHDEVDSELTEIEDGIDMNDLAIFVFAKNFKNNKDVLIIKSISSSTSAHDNRVTVIGSPGSYTVSMRMDREEFHGKIDYQIREDGEDNVEFRILVLANCSSPGTDAMAKWNKITGQTYTEVIEQLKEWKYAMSYLYNSDYKGDDAARLYSNRKHNIPMFGTDKFSVTQKALYNSREDDRVYMGDISLLRALAKVRVVDNIQNKENGFPMIIGAEFIGSQDMACQLPYNAADYEDGKQVHTPNIAQEVQLPPTNADSYTFRLGTIDSWADMTPPDQKKGVTRIAYIPEQKVVNPNNDIAQGYPIFRVTVAFKMNADGSYDQRSYNVPMGGIYNGQSIFADINAILRNHIYTLSVDQVNVGTPAQITVKVDNWDNGGTFEIEYTNALSMPSRVEWKDGTYSSKDTQNCRVYAPEWVTGEDGLPHAVPMICTFRFASPRGATWVAYLIGDNTEFIFVDKDGEQIGTNSVEGVIDGKEHTLYIETVKAKPEGGEPLSAQLQFVVRMPDGSVIQAPSTPINSTQMHWTIVQNP